MSSLDRPDRWRRPGRSGRSWADGAPESYIEYLTSGAFVEATFENWESEFLQMGAYVLLTALIQKGSPESKPVAAPHAQTGTS